MAYVIPIYTKTCFLPLLVDTASANPFRVPDPASRVRTMVLIMTVPKHSQMMRLRCPWNPRHPLVSSFNPNQRP
ncbi:hypothetical protein B0J13DRAFT_302782 [Dactylonectria estremocensis]|uniref:Uncharacterized protein n=1 Tax=Dactylonectria estremocensis TaxID=1079267 RepID=A0A9P9J5U8_9HYPO|nr:hypothetical protein B0J13DRAFT_302782 [Dactylonectria estremocensis]